MRILAVTFMLLLAMPVILNRPAQAQIQMTVDDDLHYGVLGVFDQSRQFLGNLLTEAKIISRLTDEQLYGVGVGLLGGLLAANAVGTAGIGTVFFASAGALIGKWAATPMK